MKGHRYWECDQNSPPLWDESAQNYADYNSSYSHENSQNRDCGETNVSIATRDQSEAQNIPTSVAARNQGNRLPEITEGSEDGASGGALTGPFSGT